MIAAAVSFADHGGRLRIRCAEPRCSKWSGVIRLETVEIAGRPSKTAEYLCSDHAREKGFAEAAGE